MSQIITPVVLVFAVGLIASVILAYASKLFYIQEDEKYIALRAELPGANCGGCGFAGCDDYAHALRCSLHQVCGRRTCLRGETRRDPGQKR